MRTLFIVIAASALAGCASSQKISRAGDAHEARAAELDREGRHGEALDQREAARKQYDKAARRSEEEQQLDRRYW